MKRLNVPKFCYKKSIADVQNLGRFCDIYQTTIPILVVTIIEATPLRVALQAVVPAALQKRHFHGQRREKTYEGQESVEGQKSLKLEKIEKD